MWVGLKDQLRRRHRSVGEIVEFWAGVRRHRKHLRALPLRYWVRHVPLDTRLWLNRRRPI